MPRGEWGWSRQAVARAAERLGIETLTVEYAPEEIDSMYVQCDGHTSADGFAVTARRIAGWLDGTD